MEREENGRAATTMHAAAARTYVERGEGRGCIGAPIYLAQTATVKRRQLRGASQYPILSFKLSVVSSRAMAYLLSFLLRHGCLCLHSDDANKLLQGVNSISRGRERGAPGRGRGSSPTLTGRERHGVRPLKQPDSRETLRVPRDNIYLLTVLLRNGFFSSKCRAASSMGDIPTLLAKSPDCHTSTHVD